MIRRPPIPRPVPHGEAISALARSRRRTSVDVTGRLQLLLDTLGGARPTPAAGARTTVGDLVDAVVTTLEGRGTEAVWLALAVVSGSLPHAQEVLTTRRAVELRGAAEALVAAAELTTTVSARRRVEVLTDTTLVDLGDLVSSPLGTGIQRVARNVTAEWAATHDVTLAAWTRDFDAIRILSQDERDAVLAGTVHRTAPGGLDELEDTPLPPEVVVVPWRCTYVLPELAIQPRRCAATQALAAYSPNRTAVIGFDCVPITSSETSAEGFAGVFALNLAAVAHFDVVGAISGAAAAEYEGWRRMLEGAGLPGPRVVPVSLPGFAPVPDDAALADARARLTVPGIPMVLVVGSHEPRKNHLAVLHAAELLWRRGHRFSLVFVGGAAWSSDEFTARLDALRGAGRAVESVSKLPDRLLWAAYRVARCTLFPSINEGFGLPVAESLSAGTPVITSNFGSMAEIAAGGGALLVDPRDDDALAATLERLLCDDVLLARLQAEARARPAESWAAYAEELWGHFHTTPAPLPAPDGGAPADRVDTRTSASHVAAPWTGSP